MGPSELAELPAAWQEYLRRRQLTPVSTGMGGARVWQIAGNDVDDGQYLKLGSGKAANDLRAEAERTIWLGSRNICVPRIIDEFHLDDFAAVITSALPGITGDQQQAIQHLPLLAKAFRELHSLPVDECPFDETTRVRLARARLAVESGTIDVGQFAARNAATTAAQLYARLENEPPFDEDELVVVHGDAWLSNIIIDRNGRVGFVDCGNSGRGDRYLDLAVLLESFTDIFGEEAAATFIRAYGVEAPNCRKLGFFRDLYELF